MIRSSFIQISHDKHFLYSTMIDGLTVMTHNLAPHSAATGIGEGDAAPADVPAFPANGPLAGCGNIIVL